MEDAGDTLIVGLFVLALAGVGVWILAKMFGKKKEYLCKSCGTVGKASNVTPGSVIIELALWVCFIVPGILYSLYRVTKRHKACPNCKSQDIIPKDSPIAAKMLSESVATKVA